MKSQNSGVRGESSYFLPPDSFEFVFDFLLYKDTAGSSFLQSLASFNNILSFVIYTLHNFALSSASLDSSAILATIASAISTNFPKIFCRFLTYSMYASLSSKWWKRILPVSRPVFQNSPSSTIVPFKIPIGFPSSSRRHDKWESLIITQKTAPTPCCQLALWCGVEKARGDKASLTLTPQKPRLPKF